jgi:predicted flavoprotein YhiN
VAFEEAALFTHKGLSGPAILQVSSYWSPGEPVSLCTLPDAGAVLRAARREMPKAHLKAALVPSPAHRLADALAERIGLARELGNCSDTDLEAAADAHSAHVPADRHRRLRQGRGDRGRHQHRRAVVPNDGGARGPGLYAIGEAVDVTGWLGGYNFQWAWSSGVAAGLAVAERVTAGR